MPQLLWISPFSLHDRALAPARQLLQMVRALKMMQRWYNKGLSDS